MSVQHRHKERDTNGSNCFNYNRSLHISAIFQIKIKNSCESHESLQHSCIWLPPSLLSLLLGTIAAFYAIFLLVFIRYKTQTSNDKKISEKNEVA